MTRRAACFTMVKNERAMLPIWERYYSRHFGKNDLYVLDHETQDGSTRLCECRVIPVKHPVAWDFGFIRRQLIRTQKELLQDYDVVLYCDVDEILVPDPRTYPQGLREYVQKFPHKAVKCNTYNVIHDVNQEHALDESRPILEQRSRWEHVKHWTWQKPLLGRIPLDWCAGCHKCQEDEEIVYDPELLMVHLHYVDFDICVERRYARTQFLEVKDSPLAHVSKTTDLSCIQKDFSDRLLRTEDIFLENVL